jgi:hypothetical protein
MVPLILGPLVLVGFLFWQKYNLNPILPSALFQDKVISLWHNIDVAKFHFDFRYSRVGWCGKRIT